MSDYKFVNKCFWGEKWQDMGASGYGCSHNLLLKDLGSIILYRPPCEENGYKCKYYITKEKVKNLINNLQKNIGVENL